MSYYDNAMRMRPIIERAAASLSDADALEVPRLFPAWEADTAYAAEQRIEHGGALYRCVQGHTSQSGWEPDAAPALWTAVSLDEWPEWVQPTGAHDAYNAGDRVSHKEGRWVSDMDGNTWEPGVYAWTEAE